MRVESGAKKTKRKTGVQEFVKLHPPSAVERRKSKAWIKTQISLRLEAEVWKNELGRRYIP